jgi:hypothetical protein
MSVIEEVNRGILQNVRGALGAAKPRIKKPALWGAILRLGLHSRYMDSILIGH